MSRKELQKLEGGKFRRKVRRKLGVFVDGTGLDRATRRLNKKVDLTKFMVSLSSGLTPEISRYYTLVPHEDDARQLAFLEAVERAGLEVNLKRLPPKGVKRPVSMDVQIATDMICFALNASGSDAGGSGKAQATVVDERASSLVVTTDSDRPIQSITPAEIVREAILVCPNRELRYAIHRCHELGVRVTLADFGLYGSSDGWPGVDTWVDLSISETIWRD